VESAETSIKLMDFERVTVRAPINIALVKYWGKSDEEKRLPANASLSLTLPVDEIYSLTSIEQCPDMCNCFYLGGVKGEFNHRMVRIVDAFRERGHALPPVKVTSCNHQLPTGAGLASSASGYAAFALGLVNFLKCRNKINQQELAQIARLGSGSACRSLFDDFVLWDGESVGSVPGLEWPDLRCMACIVNKDCKSVGSTEAMQRSLKTSELLNFRIQGCLPKKHIDELINAISSRDFTRFADVVMRESNQLHAICLDTMPPVNYLNERSWEIIRLIHSLNQQGEQTMAAYTFDAGPNPFIFCLKEHSSTLSSIFQCHDSVIRVIHFYQK
jgi:diphosphomevalonate decarboxylase